MRMSCNGCRVLRKGCSEDCTIRPCLVWIKTPESQANATLFLAKFYGRAGLLNLINGGNEEDRPAIFRSLLYEACGRIVNPIYGSVGLLWSGNWNLCQEAVEAVLKGAPVIQISSATAAATPMPALKAFDIRHVPKDGKGNRVPGFDLHKVAKTTRARFKRSATGSNFVGAHLNSPLFEVDQRWRALDLEPSATPEMDQNESIFSVETADASTVTSKGRSSAITAEDSKVKLELCLGPSLSLCNNTNAFRPACSGSSLQFDLNLHLTA